MGLQEMIENRLEKSEFLDKILERKVEEQFQKKCLSVLKLEQCVNYGRKMRVKNPNVSKIIIGVDENLQPFGEKDRWEVTIGALDADNQPLAKKGDEALALVVYAGTLDKELINFLDGADKKIYQL